MQTPRLWIVNPFDPVPGATFSRPMRYDGFAQALAEAGWEVTWFTADFDHITRTYRVPSHVDRAQIDRRLRLEYIHVPSYRATFGTARIRSHRAYTRRLAARLRTLADERPAAILASVPLVGSLRACLAERTRTRCAVIADVQDLWPEALENALPTGLRDVYRPLRVRLVRQERRQIGACDGVMGVSDTYLRARGAMGVPALRAYLGIDLAAFDREMRAAGLDPAARPASADLPVTLLWSGTIRPAADLPAVLAAAAILRARGTRVRFVIAGDGPSRPALEAQARRHGLGPDTVSFRGAYPDAERPGLVYESHVGLNTYVPGAANSITNKLFDYQAASLAIVNSLPGEVADLVTAHRMGRNYVAGDPGSLASAIETVVRDRAGLAAMGRAARRFAENQGSRAAISTRVAEFVESVALH